jgi:hypothetical protein
MALHGNLNETIPELALQGPALLAYYDELYWLEAEEYWFSRDFCERGSRQEAR